MTRGDKQIPNLGTYAGKWVAFLSNRIVATGASLPEVMRKLPRRGARLNPSVFLVPRQDEGPYVLGQDISCSPSFSPKNFPSPSTYWVGITSSVSSL